MAEPFYIARAVDELLEEAPLSTVLTSFPVPVAANWTSNTRATHKAVWIREYQPFQHTIHHSTDDYSRPDFSVLEGVNGPESRLPDLYFHMHHFLPPTARSLYFFAHKEDILGWFMVEISSVVVNAFNTMNTLLAQVRSHEQLSVNQDGIDRTFSVYADIRYITTGRDNGPATLVAAIMVARGHLKRDWMLDPAHAEQNDCNISAEMRGLAHCFKTPFVFCFDGETLVLLKFRATNLDQLKSEECHVDIWSLDRKTQGKWFRLALHTFVSEAWRQYSWFDRRCLFNNSDSNNAIPTIKQEEGI